MQPMVSIIMPVLNGERYITEAIHSVLAQSYSNWELLVVDDGSIDSTATIVRSFDDPRIRYTYQENRGQANALNCGIDLAQGDYITTLDADDAYPTESLQARITWLEAHPTYGAVYGNGYYCNTLGEPLLSLADYRSLTPTGDIYDQLIVHPFFGTGATVMQRRSVMDQYAIRYDETIVWCQDWDFYIRLAEKTMFGYVDALTIFYRIHETNMTKQMPQGRRLESLIRTKRKVLSASRWHSVTRKSKYEFFFFLLTSTLWGRVNDQIQIIELSQFHALPKPDQSRLLRLMASEYLLDDLHRPLVKTWLLRAWRLAPLDLKTGLVAVASMLNISLVKAAVIAWRRGHDKSGPTPSPFQHVLTPVNQQTISPLQPKEY